MLRYHECKVARSAVCRPTPLPYTNPKRAIERPRLACATSRTHVDHAIALQQLHSSLPMDPGKSVVPPVPPGGMTSAAVDVPVMGKKQLWGSSRADPLLVTTRRSCFNSTKLLACSSSVASFVTNCISADGFTLLGVSVVLYETLQCQAQVADVTWGSGWLTPST